MRGFIIIVLVLVTGFCFNSCNPCNNLDCITDNYDGQFRLVSANAGNDLVFGPTRIYEAYQIKFFSLKGADTTFFSYETIRFTGAGYDSILHVQFFPRADTAYLLLGNGDIDTLAVSYRVFDTKCCGNITEIADYRFNNSTNIPGNAGTQELRK